MMDDGESHVSTIVVFAGVLESIERSNKPDSFLPNMVVALQLPAAIFR